MIYFFLVLFFVCLLVTLGTSLAGNRSVLEIEIEIDCENIGKVF